MRFASYQPTGHPSQPASQPAAACPHLISPRATRHSSSMDRRLQGHCRESTDGHAGGHQCAWQARTGSPTIQPLNHTKPPYR